MGIIGIRRHAGHGRNAGSANGLRTDSGRQGHAGMPDAFGVCACANSLEGKPPGGAGIRPAAGRFGMTGIPGRFVGPIPGGRPAGTPGVTAACGPMPGGKPPGGISSMAGAGAAVFVPELFSRIKLRLCGKSSVTAPVSRSTRFRACGQFVSPRSMRSVFVPAI